MSTLTRVFIVLHVVFSIAFTVMTVSLVAQTSNWQDNARKFEAEARIADTNLRQMIAASAADLATERDVVRAHMERIGELEAKLQANTTETARLRSELAKSDAEKSSAEAMNRGLVAQLQVAEAARSELEKQRDNVEKSSVVLQQRNIDLNDSVNEKNARIAVMLEQRRQFEQQINILTEELKKSGRSSNALNSLENPEGAAMRNVVALQPPASGAIRGKVTDISENLVSISVGSNDGVQKDMVFVIHRGQDYIGDVRINTVTPNQSAGKLVRSSRNPERGDMVTDALALQTPR